MAVPSDPTPQSSLNQSGPDRDASSVSDVPAATAVSRLHLWEVQSVRDMLVILAVFGLVYVGYWMRSVTVPLLIALTLAYLFEPVVRRLCRFRGITRPGAVLIILLAGGVGVTFAVTFTVPIAIGQTVKLVDRIRNSDLSSIAERVIEFAPEQSRDELRQGLRWLEGQFTTGPSSEDPYTKEKESAASDEQPAKSELASGTESGVEKPGPKYDPKHGNEPHAALTEAEDQRIRELVRGELAALGVEGATPAARVGSGAPWKVLGVIGSSAEHVSGFLLGLVQLSLIAFLVPFYFYFFSVSFPSLLEFTRTLIPERSRPRALELIGAMDRAVSGFVRGRIVIAFLMGVMFALGWLLCGVKYAVPLGFFVGALSLVPYLGGVGVPLAVGLLLFDQLQIHPSERMAWWAIILWPTLVFMLVQSIESYILTPVIAGKVTDLDPVTIVVAILAGGSVAGVYGMLLAIPAAACGKILLKEVLLPRIRAWSRGDAPDPLSLESSDS